MSAPLEETRLFCFYRLSSERMNVRNTRWTNRDLLRAPRLVQAALRRARSAEDSVRTSGCCLAHVRSVRADIAVLPGLQPGEPLRVSARACSSNVSYAELAPSLGADRCSGGEWIRPV